MFRSIYHFLFAWTGSVIYRNPSEDLFVLGVTGTKGKSTTLEMINSILEEDGQKVALLSSVKKKIGDEVSKNDLPNTMPGRWQLQRFLSEAVEAGCDYALLEVTSEGVVQHRHRFVDWDGACFLNLEPEHIESHGSYENYKEAKLDFFRYLEKSNKSPKYFFVNEDDSEADDFIKVSENINNSEVVSFNSSNVDKLIQDLKKEQKENVPDWIKARFNKENLAAAASFAKALSIDMKTVKKSLLKFRGVEGRLDFVQHEPFGVVIDYAHTPESLKSLYKSLRSNFDYDGDLICVLGSAGGGRDKWKRPKIGEIVENFCDKAILTSEDPYDEDPESIVSDIEKGFSNKPDESKVPDYQKIVDRKEAIEKALSMAEKGDIVAITGIGSQPYFQGANGKMPWDEREIVKDFLKK